MHITACTADVTEENEIKCKKLKFDSILFKPVSLLKLENLTKKILYWHLILFIIILLLFQIFVIYYFYNLNK